MSENIKRVLFVALALFLLNSNEIPKPSDGEAFLWRPLAKIAPGLLPLHQGQVGSCVGAGHAGAVDVLLGADALKSGIFYPASIESIYGGSRCEARGNGHNYGGDGSYGAAAVRWLNEIGGVVFAKPYPEYGVDLSTYSASKARQYGRDSNGADGTINGKLDAEAKKHPVKSVAKVTTIEELDRALLNGYPVTVCSGVGYVAKSRDADGFVKRNGRWAHCMFFAGKRQFPRPGYLIVNSWGNYLSGPKYPDDQPDGSFWVSPEDALAMLRQNDSYALSNVEGFPRRILPDWLSDPAKMIPDVAKEDEPSFLPTPDPISTPTVQPQCKDGKCFLPQRRFFR